MLDFLSNFAKKQTKLFRYCEGGNTFCTLRACLLRLIIAIKQAITPRTLLGNLAFN